MDSRWKEQAQGRGKWHVFCSGWGGPTMNLMKLKFRGLSLALASSKFLGGA